MGCCWSRSKEGDKKHQDDKKEEQLDVEDVNSIDDENKNLDLGSDSDRNKHVETKDIV